MTTPSKKLTVSLGAFSCTLDGFDDPVPLMKDVVEYFRDMSKDSPQFGFYPGINATTDLESLIGGEVGSRVVAGLSNQNLVISRADEIDASDAQQQIELEEVWDDYDFSVSEKGKAVADEASQTEDGADLGAERNRADDVEAKDMPADEALADETTTLDTEAPEPLELETPIETGDVGDGAAADDALAEELRDDAIEPLSLDTSVANGFDHVAETSVAAEDSAPLTLDTPVEAEDSAPLTLDTPVEAEDSAPLTPDTPVAAEDSAPLTLDTPVEVEDSAPLTLDTPVEVEDSAPLTLDTPVAAGLAPLALTTPVAANDPLPPLKLTLTKSIKPAVDETHAAEASDTPAETDDAARSPAPLTLDTPVEPLALTQPVKPGAGVAASTASAHATVTASAADTGFKLGFGGVLGPDESREPQIATEMEVEDRKKAQTTAVAETVMSGFAEESTEFTFDKKASAQAALAPLQLTTPVASGPSSHDSLHGFSRSIGANTLEEMLEASAAFLTLVKGDKTFRRNDVTAMIDDLVGGAAYSDEDRVRAFALMVNEGRFLRSGTDQYALGPSTREAIEAKVAS